MTLAIPLTDRIARLAQSFHELKERVRDAVATEMGKVVADAVRDWITGALISRRSPLRDAGRPEESRYDGGWDDPPDGWEDRGPIADPPPEPVEPRTQSPRWAAALSIGVVAARWLISRRMPLAPSLGIGFLAGLCTVAGGPLVQSVLAASNAAADLAVLARPEPHPVPLNFLRTTRFPIQPRDRGLRVDRVVPCHDRTVLPLSPNGVFP